jgi:hypothetical protein
MDVMAAGYEQSKEMIRRYDEVISDKANKSAIKDVYEAMKPLVRTADLRKIQDGIQNQFQEALDRHEKLRQTLDFVSDNVTKEIHSAVRRSVANLKA